MTRTETTIARQIAKAAKLELAANLVSDRLIAGRSARQAVADVLKVKGFRDLNLAADERDRLADYAADLMG